MVHIGTLKATFRMNMIIPEPGINARLASPLGLGFRVYYIYVYTWVVVTIMVPFWIPIRIPHLKIRVPKKGP